MSKKEQIIEKLKENGCRITKQRRMLIDIILENECSSCKEIFYKASKTDEKIGVATVYRMINALEEIGAISRKNMYKVECSEDCPPECGCEIVLDDDTTYHLSPGSWNKVIREGLKRCGYLKNQKIARIKVQPDGEKEKTDGSMVQS
ncbi:MAG: transcriptional repressor [Mediterraneibacter sp.]|nr:transcriptional repressor [Candidatus Mediterraneibacter caccogallinarum]